MGLLILVETLARHGFDDRPQEAVVEVAIGEIGARCLSGRREMGAAFPIGTAGPKEGPDADGWRDTVDFAVAQARRMGRQLAERNRHVGIRRMAQAKAEVLADILVEGQLPCFGELHNRKDREHLGDGRHAETAVFRHGPGLCPGHAADTAGKAVDLTAAGIGQDGQAGHAGPAVANKGGKIAIPIPSLHNSSFRVQKRTCRRTTSPFEFEVVSYPL